MYIISKNLYLQFTFINIIIIFKLFKRINSLLNEIKSEAANLLGLKPYKNKVGKQIGSQIWFHSDYSELFHSYLINANDIYDKIDFIPDIIRIDTKSNNMALIKSPDFDTSNEPYIEKSALFEDGILKKISLSGDNPQIYHHKWMFVDEEYSRFDYFDSVNRSIQWKRILGKNRALSSRIGRKNFWLNWLRENGIKE